MESANESWPPLPKPHEIIRARELQVRSARLGRGISLTTRSIVAAGERDQLAVDSAKYGVGREEPERQVDEWAKDLKER